MPDSRWLPISEAPKDGTRILLYAPEWAGCHEGWYDTGVWWRVDAAFPPTYSPTHFMPLPEPPDA